MTNARPQQEIRDTQEFQEKARTLRTEFRNRKNLPGIAVVTAEYSCIALAMIVGYVFPQWWLYPIIVLVIGTRQYALAEIMTHEASHRNLCKSQKLNRYLGMLTSWPFLQTFEGYLRFHMAHHRVPLASEDNNIQEEYELWRLPEPDEKITQSKAFWLFVIRPLTGIIGVYHAIAHIGDLYYDRDLKENTYMVVFWAILLIAAWHLGVLGLFVLYWIVPQLYVLATLNYWSEVGDHYRVAGAETRSDLNWFLNRLISHNIGYHALHHADPRIPWYLLPRAYNVYRRNLAEQVSGGYIETFKQIVRGETTELRSTTIL